MSERKSSISKAKTYQEIGEFWDSHDLGDYWKQTKPADLEIEIASEATYYPLDMRLTTALRALASRRGVSPETLINLWVQEKLQQET
jgi:hypothetical protein